MFETPQKFDKLDNVSWIENVWYLKSDPVSDGKRNERKDSDEAMEVEINVDTPRPPRWALTLKCSLHGELKIKTRVLFVQD